MVVLLKQQRQGGHRDPKKPQSGVVIRVLWPAELYGNDYGISRHEIERMLAKELLGFSLSWAET